MAATLANQPQLMQNGIADTTATPSSRGSTPTADGNNKIVGIIYPPPNIRGTM